MNAEAFGIVPILQQDQGVQFLLIQHWAGHWGFPKGHAEPGESALETACREFEEETGIQTYQVLTNISFVEHYCFTRGEQSVDKTVTYFPAVVQAMDVTQQEQEIKDYAWLTFEAALQRMTFDQGKQLLVTVNEYLQGLDDATP